MRRNSSRFHSSSRRSVCLLDWLARASTRLGNPGERQNCARDRPCARQCAIRPRAAASPGRRDLPIRGSPETRNIRPPPRLAFSIAALSSSSSRLRPTNRAELELGGGFVFHRHDSSPLWLLVREKVQPKTQFSGADEEPRWTPECAARFAALQLSFRRVRDRTAQRTGLSQIQRRIRRRAPPLNSVAFGFWPR